MEQLLAYARQFERQVWIQSLGRCLFLAGYGLFQFYLPIVFVNQVGFSATAVGVGLSSASLAGAAGKFASGSLAESPRWGRKKTLLLAVALVIVALLLLAIADGFPLFWGATVLLGLGASMYWPVSNAALTDLTAPQQRNEGFALLGVAESLGLALGVAMGGGLLAWLERGQLLFAIDSLVMLAFLGVMQALSAETRPATEAVPGALSGWGTALRDKWLGMFLGANLLFTTYFALANNALPLYFANFVLGDRDGSAIDSVTSLLSWQIAFGALLQLPVARWLGRLTRASALLVAMLLWGVGLLLVWMTGVSPAPPLAIAPVALGTIALASVAYQPFAGAIVAELAPRSLRGVYAALSAQCWSVGYALGPLVGGWALDRGPPLAHNGWLALAATTIAGLIALSLLERAPSRLASEMSPTPSRVLSD